LPTVQISSKVALLNKQESNCNFTYYGNEFLSIAIDDKTINELKRFSSIDEKKYEAGGVLFGYRYNNGIEIANITSPMRRDIRKPFAFIRKDRQHLSIAEALWINSGNKCDYIGEWHTHPSGNAESSFVDKMEWGKLYKSFGKPIITIIQSPSNFRVYCVGT
jgi:integrative and conjugative element protein (TIGR02256 family)